MSEKPLKRLDPTKPALVVCPDADEFQRVLNSYGLDAIVDHVIAVYSYEDAVIATTIYPADSPWCVPHNYVGMEIARAKEMMYSYFGPPKLVSETFQAQNMEYAIHPRLLDQPPTT